MKLLDVVTAPWAITDEVHRQIEGIYLAHAAGPKIDLNGLEARLGMSGSRDRSRISTLHDGVLVIDVEGPIAKRMSSLTAICGGTSAQLVSDTFAQAVNDPAVRAIILAIDSPGGAVDGTRDLAQAVFEARGRKPIVALADGCMCSAAYWIGAAADRVLIANETTQVGSIGVIASHVDRSIANEKAGLKFTTVKAGRFKQATSNPNEPLSDEGLALLEGMVNDIYGLFTQDISTFRGVPLERVLERMAEGRVFMGSKAIEAGLADGVSSLESLIEKLSQGQTTQAGAGAARKTKPITSTEANMPITREELAAQDGGQDLINALVEEGKASALAEAISAAETRIQQIKVEAQESAANATNAETERVLGILDAASGLEGHDALVKASIADGKTTPEAAAVKILGAEKAKAPLRRIREEAPGGAKFGGEAEDDSLDASEKALRERWNSSASVRSLYGTFEAFASANAAATEAAKNGRIQSR